MSNLLESVSERNVDLNRSSTSQSVSNEPFQPKSSAHNKRTEGKDATKESPNLAVSGQKPHQSEITAESMNKITNQYANLEVSSQNDNIGGDGGGSDITKRKNAGKKERRRQLQLQIPQASPVAFQANSILPQAIPTVPQASPVMPQVSPTMPQSSMTMPQAYPTIPQASLTMHQTSLTMPWVNSTMPQPQQPVSCPVLIQSQGQHEISLQELFIKQISPLYASTNSRYLESVTHYPQYHFMQNRHNMPVMCQGPQYATSVLNTPITQTTLIPNHSSIPNSPISLSEASTPRYIQNMMQHPLLSKSFSIDKHNNFPHAQINAQSGSIRNPSESTSQGYAIRKPLLSQSLPTDISKDLQQVHQSSVTVGSKTSPLEKTSRRVRKRKQNNDDIRFEPYLSEEEVEAGMKSNIFFESVLRINPKQYSSAYVSNDRDRNEQDILIEGIKNRNRALEGDIVVVQVTENSGDSEENSEEKQKKGKVVYIKQRVHNRRCIGNLRLMLDKNRQRALFVPRDNRVPKLNIAFNTWPNNFYNNAKGYENTLFLAKITDWYDTRFAIGRIECNIGQSGELVTETKAILAQTDLDVTPFGPDVKNLYPGQDYTIPEEELKKREDCRKLCLFSIDPVNCRDIDDAVSCKKLESGNYEVGVHISDVAHFLTENTVLDEKVSLKATTIYLVEKAYHMLPDDLCTLCSLFPGVDKLAFSVFWEITEDAKVLNHRFSKSVIHSCAQLSYDHAQAVLDDREDAESNFPETYNGFQYRDIHQSIKILGKIAAALRKSRFDTGALRIDQPKISFDLNPSNGLPDTYWIYEIKESNQLIEEFMLLANMTVAKRIHEDHPKLAFLRCHPPPSGYMMQQLAKTLKPMGIEIDYSTAGSLHRSLLPYVGPENKDPGRAMVLNMLSAKPMTRARYFCAHGCDDDEFSHYALNVPLYTHFTSPIRRYADIMVHRLLAASLKYKEMPDWEVKNVCAVAANCNKQKYNAKKAGELSVDLYILKYIEMNSPIVTEAVVVDVKKRYIDVIVIAMGWNRRIYFNDDSSTEYKCTVNEAGIKLSKMELTWHATADLPEVKQVIEVFSVMKIEMHKTDEIFKVETKILRPL